jgi:hypothetical protein
VTSWRGQGQLHIYLYLYLLEKPKRQFGAEFKKNIIISIYGEQIAKFSA